MDKIQSYVASVNQIKGHVWERVAHFKICKCPPWLPTMSKTTFYEDIHSLIKANSEASVGHQGYDQRNERDQVLLNFLWTKYLIRTDHWWRHKRGVDFIISIKKNIFWDVIPSKDIPHCSDHGTVRVEIALNLKVTVEYSKGKTTQNAT